MKIDFATSIDFHHSLLLVFNAWRQTFERTTMVFPGKVAWGFFGDMSPKNVAFPVFENDS